MGYDNGLSLILIYEKCQIIIWIIIAEKEYEKVVGRSHINVQTTSPGHSSAHFLKNPDHNLYTLIQTYKNSNAIAVTTAYDEPYEGSNRNVNWDRQRAYELMEMERSHFINSKYPSFKMVSETVSEENDSNVAKVSWSA